MLAFSNDYYGFIFRVTQSVELFCTYYYHAKHCYCHGATEVIWNLLIIGFNMREIYLYRRIHGFIKRGISRKSVSRIFCDDLQTEKVKNILYEESG